MLTDPRTGGPRATPPISGQLEVDSVVARARKGFDAWSRLAAAERSRRMLRLAEAIDLRREDYVAAERAGTGKPLDHAQAELEQAVDVLRFYAGAARADLAPAGGRRIAGHESWVRWEPLGVVATIIPWNYPLLIAVWRLAPAICTGNAVVVKPALTTPESAMLLTEDATEALGEDILLVLPGDRETGRLLVRSSVDAIAFTGSKLGGLDVMVNAGLRRVSLELGGNAPAIVLPDAPYFTCQRLVDACTYNAGQSCAAPARVITLRENHEQVVAELSRELLTRDAGVDFGPLNNPDQLDRYDRILDESGAAERWDGGIRTTDAEAAGYWRPATLLASVPADDITVREEVFGPTITVQAASSVDSAIDMANSMPQALSASLWSTSISPLLSLAPRIEAGEVWINCHLEQTAELPHGGRRESGTGTDLSVIALSEYQRPKTVTASLSTTVRAGP